MSPLLIISIISPLVAVLIGIKKRTSLLWLYPFTGLFFDVLISIMKRGLHVNHKWPANIFILLEFLILSFIYRKKIFKNDRVFYIFLGVLSSFFIGHTVYRSVFIFNKVGGSLFTLCYLIFSVVGFFTILKKQESVYLERSWFFWLNVALVIYASGNFFLFLFRDVMMTLDQELYLLLWNNIFLFLNIIKNLLIAIALYHFTPVKREPH